jgi:hypothetical protein
MSLALLSEQHVFAALTPRVSLQVAGQVDCGGQRFLVIGLHTGDGPSVEPRVSVQSARPQPTTSRATGPIPHHYLGEPEFVDGPLSEWFPKAGDDEIAHQADHSRLEAC